MRSCPLESGGYLQEWSPSIVSISNYLLFFENTGIVSVFSIGTGTTAGAQLRAAKRQKDMSMLRMPAKGVLHES
jgi:hypothetical protein